MLEFINSITLLKLSLIFTIFSVSYLVVGFRILNRKSRIIDGWLNVLGPTGDAKTVVEYIARDVANRVAKKQIDAYDASKEYPLGEYPKNTAASHRKPEYTWKVFGDSHVDDMVNNAIKINGVWYDTDTVIFYDEHVFGEKKAEILEELANRRK